MHGNMHSNALSTRPTLPLCHTKSPPLVMPACLSLWPIRRIRNSARIPRGGGMGSNWMRGKADTVYRPALPMDKVVRDGSGRRDTRTVQAVPSPLTFLIEVAHVHGLNSNELQVSDLLWSRCFERRMHKREVVRQGALPRPWHCRLRVLLPFLSPCAALAAARPLLPPLRRTEGKCSLHGPRSKRRRRRRAEDRGQKERREVPGVD